MKASLRRMCLPAAVFAIGACAVSSPQVSTPAADASTSFATTAPPRRVLGDDETTKKTHRLLAAAGATDLEGLKPMDMEGMDHSSMDMEHSHPAGAPQPATSPAPATQAPMDHSQHGAPAASPTPAQTAPVPEAEHGHTSEPKASGAAKAAPDAPQPKPAALQKPEGGMDHSNH